jgi:hypothetical protein
MSSPFAFAPGSSDGVGPGRGVPCASLMLSCASLRALPASEYPSGRDHQLRKPQVFAAWFAGIDGGCGGNGGSLISGVTISASSSTVSGGFFAFVSSVWPFEDTLTVVMEVGSALPLLDLRLVRNLVGESSLGFLASSPGSSPVAPPVTPMLSVAVLVEGGAFERQLPDPPSHFLPFGVWLPVVVGVDAPSDVAVDSAKDLFDGAFWVSLLSLGVVEVVVLAVLASGGTPASPSCVGSFVREERRSSGGETAAGYTVSVCEHVKVRVYLQRLSRLIAGHEASDVTAVPCSAVLARLLFSANF